MDYNSLTQQILNYANRNEPNFVAAIPQIINQAMSRIYSEVKTIGFQKSIGDNMIAGNPAIDKPVDYKESISLQYFNNSNSTILLERSYEFCITYWPDRSLRAAPTFYSADLEVPQNDAGNSLIYLAATPDQNYPYIFKYVSFPPVFDANNSRNFLTDKYPNLLLYACMVEAIPFLKSDERIPVFESFYNRAVQATNKDTKERYTDRYSVRDKN
jgi:hypothetical protein